MTDFPGSPDDDDITGTDGKDTIHGQAGFDTLFGLKGKDFLDGGPDDDQLTGGKGHDTFAFVTGGGEDQIEDFQLGKDGFDFSGTTFGRKDLKDINLAGTIHDSDGDGNYVSESFSNGEPELQIHFASQNTFDSLTILNLTLADLKHDIRHNLDHYDFY